MPVMLYLLTGKAVPEAFQDFYVRYSLFKIPQMSLEIPSGKS